MHHLEELRRLLNASILEALAAGMNWACAAAVACPMRSPTDGASSREELGEHGIVYAPGPDFKYTAKTCKLQVDARVCLMVKVPLYLSRCGFHFHLLDTLKLVQTLVQARLCHVWE